MKKIGIYFLAFILSIIVFLLGFQFESKKEPNTLYKVYLQDTYIGSIQSKKELEDYINSQASVIRENVRDYSKKIDAYDTYEKLVAKYEMNDNNSTNVAQLLNDKKQYDLSDIDVDNLEYYLEEKIYELNEYSIREMKEYIESNDIYMHVEEVYTPNGIDIKKVYTYENNYETVQEIYKKIIAKESCSIAGYKFTIKREEQEEITVYTLDKEIMNDAIERLIKIFIDDNDYENYKNNTQEEIKTTGSVIDNVYVEEEITYKAVNISVEEKIYTDSKGLSAYLLYGDDYNETIVTVKKGDSIESISFDNQISVQEFLIFNPQYTSRENLLVPGTEAVISTIDPKIQIVVETHEVVDKETKYNTVEKYDSSMIQGNTLVVQEGENGLERVSQNVKTVNGQINYVEPLGKETIKNSVPKIINIGTRYIPTVGSTSSWGLPVNPGYTLSSYYGYRPMTFGSTWHSGLDFAGTGYGSPVYAINNGVIQTIETRSDYGNYIFINHNNGYYSLYAHMSGFAKGLSVGSTVERGQTIGYVGSTGWATGPHLHLEIRTCEQYSCTTNPLNYYR